VPIDAGHLVTSGITETNYTDCGCSPGANSLAVWPCQTAGWHDEVRLHMNENGESEPSNEDRASAPEYRGAVRLRHGDDAAGAQCCGPDRERRVAGGHEMLFPCAVEDRWKTGCPGAHRFGTLLRSLCQRKKIAQRRSIWAIGWSKSTIQGKEIPSSNLPRDIAVAEFTSPRQSACICAGFGQAA